MSATRLPASVLIVEDDARVVEPLERFLAREGCGAAWTSTGGGALDWLGSHTPDLLLVGLRLRDSSGLELVKQVSAEHRSIPFAFFAARGEERAAIQMMKQGALVCLRKDP